MDTAEKKNKNNIIKVRKETAAIGGATNKNAAIKNAAAGINNDAKDTEGKQDKNGELEPKKRKCKYTAEVEKV